MFFVGGLRPVSDARTVRAHPNDEVLIFDGPHLAGKEHAGGFWVLEVADMNEALTWAGRAAKVCRAPVEVRQSVDVLNSSFCLVDSGVRFPPVTQLPVKWPRWRLAEQRRLSAAYGADLHCGLSVYLHQNLPAHRPSSRIWTFQESIANSRGGLFFLCWDLAIKKQERITDFVDEINSVQEDRNLQ